MDIEFDDLLNPYDKDHIDNDSSNNDISNLQLLSLIAHRHKTLSNVYHDEINKNKGLFIAKMINNLSKSNHFRRLIKNGKITVNINEYDNDGILNIKI